MLPLEHRAGDSMVAAALHPAHVCCVVWSLNRLGLQMQMCCKKVWPVFVSELAGLLPRLGTGVSAVRLHVLGHNLVPACHHIDTTNSQSFISGVL
jgi:hypothetical protein